MHNDPTDEFDNLDESNEEDFDDFDDNDEAVGFWAFDETDDPQLGFSAQLLCHRCNVYTWHQLMDIFTNRRSVKYDSKDGKAYADPHIDRWRIWMCGGCETLVAQQENHSKMVDRPLDPWEWEDDEYHHPPPPRPSERPTKPYYKMPPKIWELYRQSNAAYNAGAFLLASGGVRALLEAICMNKGANALLGSDGQPVENLEKKIKVLQPLMPPDSFEHLDAIRHLGNDGLHKQRSFIQTLNKTHNRYPADGQCAHTSRSRPELPSSPGKSLGPTTQIRSFSAPQACVPCSKQSATKDQSLRAVKSKRALIQNWQCYDPMWAMPLSIPCATSTSWAITQCMRPPAPNRAMWRKPFWLLKRSSRSSMT